VTTVAEVERVLLGAGELRATDRAGGFVIEEGEEQTVEVRWRVPSEQDASGAPLSELEYCASVLRDAGIRATLVADESEPRVVCLVRRRVGRPRKRSSDSKAPATGPE